MKTFMDNDFLLSTQTARHLFHDYAKQAPIIDYHCHINPKEIALDRQFENITRIWLGEDHYKWRFMRSCGVNEKYITGDASDYEKFLKWAKCIEKAIGNPLFHWSHLELRRYFGYNGVLNAKTAEEVWNLCNEKLKQPSMSVRNLILRSNVALICTTDDPADSLEWHRKISEDEGFDVAVLPTWRPDRSMNIEKPDYADYLKKLAASADMKDISSYASLKTVLQKRMAFFASMGCKSADHGLEYVMYVPAAEEEIETIFLKRRNKMCLSREEILKFKTAFLLFCGREYHRLNWAMQLHYGCRRDSNTPMYDLLGPDTGYDCISNYTPSAQMTDFLNALHITEELPRTVIYSLNPNDNAVIDTIIGCFQDSLAVSKIQHGSAWWFNDHKAGMQEQLISLANLGNLSGFIGMLTDSRSFLSYTRHEYFRRILCNLIGDWVENGEFPNDRETLGRIVTDICCDNARRYFGFSL